MTIQVEFKGDKIFVTRKVKLLFDKFVVKTQVSNTNTVAFAIQENYRITKEVIEAHRDAQPTEAKSFEEAMEQAEFHAALSTVKAAEHKGIVYEKVDQSEQAVHEPRQERLQTGPDLARPIGLAKSATEQQQLLIDYIKQVDWKVYGEQIKPAPGETKAEFVQRHFASLAPHFERIYDDALYVPSSNREERRGAKTPPSEDEDQAASDRYRQQLAMEPTIPSVPTTPLPASAEPTEDEFGTELTESTLFSSSPLPVRAQSPTKVAESDKAKKLLADQVKFDNLILPKQPDWLKFHE